MPQQEPYNEKQILQQVSAGEERAFRLLYDRYRNKTFTIAFKMLSTEAEALDAVQEIFIKLWIHRTQLGALDNFNAYLNTVSRHHIFNLLRKQAYETTLLQELSQKPANRSEEVEQITDMRELKQILYKAIQRLSPQQRKVFELSRLEGKKQEDIAREMNISRETVKRHLAEATRNLRKILHPEGLAGVLLFLLTARS